MSTFTDTKPAGSLQYFVGVFAAAFVVYGLSFAGYQFLIQGKASSHAAEEIHKYHGEVVDKLKAEAKKKLPKGEKPDDAKLTKEAEARLESDAKVKESYEKKTEEIKHHAEGGLFPLSCFFAVASALLGGIFASVLLVKRNKDSRANAWLAFASHLPVYPFFALVAFLPILGHLAHHADTHLVEFIKENTPVTIGAGVAALGALVLVIMGVLPSRKGHDDDHGHGECCGCSH